MRAALLLVFMLCGGFAAADAEMSAEDLERWFLEDPAAEDTSGVSEGTLRFLPHGSVGDPYISRNQFTIGKDSFDTGLVTLRQCHHQLDAVPALEIVYRYKRITDLSVESARSIDKVWVQGDTVQLQGVQQGASLCVTARVGILYHTGEDRYELVNGPYHRQFLDGFYPMRVVLDIRYPADLAVVTGTAPETQPGVRVEQEPGKVLLDVLFEGRLFTRVYFRRQQ